MNINNPSHLFLIFFGGLLLFGLFFLLVINPNLPRDIPVASMPCSGVYAIPHITVKDLPVRCLIELLRDGQ